MLEKAAGVAVLTGTGLDISYLRFVSFFYLFCFTGNTFTGYYGGTGKVLLPFVGALGHISVRVVLSWLLFSRFGLNAVAFATGIGWLCGNAFWGGCKFWLARRRN